MLISIHALLAESDNNINNSVSTADKDFYPRSPCGERPNFSCLPIELSHISIHALLAESDCCARCHCWGLNEFLSTLSLRRATGRVETAITSIGFLSTLSLRRATISIALSTQPIRFLSTLSLRRATLAGPSGPAFLFNFYPRSPCGERLWPGLLARPFFLISIHALLAESDCYSLRHSAQNRHFYPRSPCGERPPCCGWFEVIHYFYPRSPCGERPAAKNGSTRSNNFYPRSPCGERRVTVLGIQHRTGISIHALLAESDLGILGRRLWYRISIHALLAESDSDPVTDKAWALISIHALLAESDVRRLTWQILIKYFYPRSPCGERRGIIWRHIIRCRISIHALLAESDGIPNQVGTWEVISIHALLAESDKRFCRCPLLD